MESQGIAKISTVNTEGDMNVCTEFNLNKFKCSQDILFKSTNINLIVVPEKSVSPKSMFILWEP